MAVNFHINNYLTEQFRLCFLLLFIINKMGLLVNYGHILFTI